MTGVERENFIQWENSKDKLRAQSKVSSKELGYQGPRMTSGIMDVNLSLT